MKKPGDFLDNTQRVQGMIRREEEKYLALLSRSPAIIRKQLGGRQKPTLDDLIVLHDRHGVHAEIVLMNLELPEDSKLCDRVYAAVQQLQTRTK